MRNSRVLPPVTSVPTSTFRSVMTPSNGAFTVAVTLHSLQARDIRFRGRHIASLDGNGLLKRLHARRARLVLGLILVVFLTRGDTLSRKTAPSLRRHAGEFRVRFALLKIRQRLVHSCLCLLQVRLRLAALSSISGASISATVWPAWTRSPISTNRRATYPSARARIGASVIAWILPGSSSVLLVRNALLQSLPPAAEPISCSCVSSAISALRF